MRDQSLPGGNDPAILGCNGEGQCANTDAENGMGEAVWREKELLALEYLADRLPSTPTSLTSDAWLETAIK